MSRRPPDPVQVALAQAQALVETLRADPELAHLESCLLPTVIASLRQRSGLLPCAAVEPDDFEAGFAAFRELYPVKCAWGAVREEIKRKIKARRWPGWPAVLAAVRAQLQSERWRAGTIPNPKTWVHGERWEDDPATLKAVNGNGSDVPPACLTESESRQWPYISRAEREVVYENARQRAMWEREAERARAELQEDCDP